MAGTSLGQVSDSYTTELPPNGTIFDSLDRHGISLEELLLEPPVVLVVHRARHSTLEQGRTRPHLGLLRRLRVRRTSRRSRWSIPTSTCRREENPQDVQYGDVFLSQVVDAVTSGPKWSKTLADLELRRARGLLRPCPASSRGDARRHAPDARPRRRAGCLRPARVPGSRRGGEPVRAARTTSRTPSTTTPRSCERSRSSGTSLRSPGVTPRPTTCSTWSTSSRHRPSSTPRTSTRPPTPHRKPPASPAGQAPFRHRAR